MAGTARVMLILLLGGTLASRANAQTSGRIPAAPQESATDSLVEPAQEFLRTFPRPPDQPASLLAPAPPLGPPPANLEEPYFQQDPLVNPPQLGEIGWFADVDAGILKPHLLNHLNQSITFPDGSSTTVGVNAVPLNWTVSPRIEIGYRFPTGFGGFALAYRNLASKGTQGLIGADGPGTLSSRLNVNVVDMDWVSNEYTRRSSWELRWRIGLRYLNAYFDSQANEPFAEAALGTTIYNQRTTNSTWALGPHAGVDVRRHLGFGGLAIVGFVDASDGWSFMRQNYFASSTTNAFGFPQTGQLIVTNDSAAPVLTTRLGLNWQPPASPNLRMFIGGQWDYWWNIGRNSASATAATGYFFDSGFLLRGEWNF